VLVVSIDVRGLPVGFAPGAPVLERVFCIDMGSTVEEVEPRMMLATGTILGIDIVAAPRSVSYFDNALETELDLAAPFLRGRSLLDHPNFVTQGEVLVRG